MRLSTITYLEIPALGAENRCIAHEDKVVLYVERAGRSFPFVTMPGESGIPNRRRPLGVPDFADAKNSHRKPKGMKVQGGFTSCNSGDCICVEATTKNMNERASWLSHKQ